MWPVLFFGSPHLCSCSYHRRDFNIRLSETFPVKINWTPACHFVYTQWPFNYPWKKCSFMQFSNQPITQQKCIRMGKLLLMILNDAWLLLVKGAGPIFQKTPLLLGFSRKKSSLKCTVNCHWIFLKNSEWEFCEQKSLVFRDEWFKVIETQRWLK